MTAWWRGRYGASPLHLLILVASFAVSAYAALLVSRGPLPVRTAVWFAGAVLAHDLVLFPLYALADRSLTGLRRRPTAAVRSGSVNFVRVPFLLSGLLLLMFFPLVLRKSEGPYGAASGLDESPYLGRWLLITGVLFAGSALAYAVRAGRQRTGSGPDA